MMYVILLLAVVLLLLMLMLSFTDSVHSHSHAYHLLHRHHPCSYLSSVATHTRISQTTTST